ncbi:hypothetical protein [Leisingera caerulea]|uniref:hypothetical protein n=1 Tax=Leisingera caerulea TaxID=506591 RepID=UPI003F4AED59
MKLAVSTVLAAVGLMMAIGGASAQSYRYCVNELGVRTSAESLIRCLNELSFRLEKAENEVRRLENRMFSLLSDQETAAIPSGAIMAFDLPGGCPVGWRQYRQLSGRVIVGTGRSGNTDAKDEFLTARELYDRGGRETVTLSIEEMPTHRHGIPMVTAPHDFLDDGVGTNAPYFDYSRRSDVRTKIGDSRPDQGVYAAGSGGSHENMPPFLALHYCLKD